MEIENKSIFFTAFPFVNSVDFPKHARVFITGGTGFIGGRLAEVLINHFQAEVFLLVRDFGKAIPLSKYPVNYIWGSLDNEDWVNKAPGDIDFIFHCAYGNKGDADTRKLTDVEGSRNILKFAKAKAVKRIVFLSTQSVYGTQPEGTINETTSKKPFDAYGVNKLMAEEIFNTLGVRENIPFVIIQPTAVIGPGAPSYVVRPIKEIKQYTVGFVNDGNGILNWIYIDDLIDGMLRSCTINSAVGNTFLLNGGEPITYFDYYTKLANLLGLSFSYAKLSAAENKSYNKKAGVLEIIKKSILIDRKAARQLLNYSFFKKMYSLGRAIKPSKKGKQLRINTSSTVKKPVSPVAEVYVKFISSKALISSKKAKDILGYAPAFYQEGAFKRIAEWYAWKFRYND